MRKLPFKNPQNRKKKKARVINVRGLYFVERADGTSYQVENKEEGERDILEMEAKQKE